MKLLYRVTQRGGPAETSGLDIRAALWVSFWLYITQKGDPDILDAFIGFLSRLLGGPV